MTSQTWRRPTSPDVAARRAGGRRKYNQLRQAAALMRGLKICQLLAQGYDRDTIATELGIHRRTLMRDLERLQTLTLRPSYFLR